MSKFLRTLSCILVCVLLLPTLGGCSQNKQVIATCGEYEIYYEQLRFATLNFKLELDELYGDGDSTNGTIWDDPTLAAKYKPMLEERVWGLMRDNYAILSACAAYGIGKDVMEGDAVKAAVEKQMEDLRNYHGTYAAYEEAIEASFMTEDVFRFYFAIEEMKTLLYAAMKDKKEFTTDEEAFHKWLLEGNCAYVQHVMREVSEGDDKAVERIFIEDMYDTLTAFGVDPIEKLPTLINSIMHEDPTNTAPYYLVRGVHDDKLVDASLALEEVGDVSTIIELENAFYILVRMEDEEDTLSSKLTTLLNDYQWSVVGDRVEEAKQSLQFEKTDFYNGLDLLAIE